jgi:cation transport protein ChaC
VSHVLDRPLKPLSTAKLTDEELRRSIEETLAGWNRRGDLWLFAYGSLMWSPNCEFSQRKAGRIYGYHRSFCLWSRINRGTPERPGLVLALERGGSCHGFAYRIPKAKVESLMWPLWQREMLYGSYKPSWLQCHLDKSVVSALAFVINPEASGYCGHLDEQQRAQCIAGACGRYGTSAEYLFKTVEALDTLGVHDHTLHQLAARVRECEACMPGESVPRPKRSR